MPTEGSTTRVVCDASALVTVLLDSGDDGNWIAARLSGLELFAPDLLPFECANIFRRHELSGLVSADQAAQAHADLLDLPIDFFPYGTVAHRVWELRRNLTSYDAAYVALAELVRAPLVTMDRRLLTAPGIACVVEAPPR